MNKIVLTGSEGLIGSEIKKQLQERLPTVEIYPIDTKIDPALDVRYIKELPDNIDGIIHLAAVSRVIDAEKDPEKCIDINFRGTLHMLNLIKDRPNKPWFIFGSSREVFGESKILPAKEHWPKVPVQVYGVVKLACENLCEIYSKRYGLKTRILRFSNVYTDEHDQLSRVIPKFILRAQRNLVLEINGTGDETFDFTHIEDTGKAVLATLQEIETSSILSNDFNILTGIPTTLKELAVRIRLLTESQSEIVCKEGRSYDVDKFYGDTTKAKEFLNWSAEIGLTEGLKKSAEILKNVPQRIAQKWLNL
jgi:nucleoside-diphosphate-sugar epimerase